MGRSKARALIRLYKSVRGHARAIEHKTACWKVEEDAGVQWEEHERDALHEASKKFDEAHREFDSVYAQRIGELVVAEIRSGDWKGSD